MTINATNNAVALATKAQQAADKAALEAKAVATLIEGMGAAAETVPSWALFSSVRGTGEGVNYDGTSAHIHGNGAVTFDELRALVRAFPPAKTVLYQGYYTSFIPAAHVEAYQAKHNDAHPRITPMDPFELEFSRFGHRTMIKVSFFAALPSDGRLVEFNFELLALPHAATMKASKVGTKYIYDPALSLNDAATPTLSLCSVGSRRYDKTSWPVFTVRSTNHGAVYRIIEALTTEQ